jgi:hypothetical protein
MRNEFPPLPSPFAVNRTATERAALCSLNCSGIVHLIAGKAEPAIRLHLIG